MNVRSAYRVAVNMVEYVVIRSIRNLMKAFAWPFNKAVVGLDSYCVKLETQTLVKFQEGK